MGCANAYPNLCGELGHIRRKVLENPISRGNFRI